MSDRRFARWAVALFVTVASVAVTGTTATTAAAGQIGPLAAQKIQNRAGGCLAAQSIAAGAYVNVVSCTTAHRWVVRQHPTNPNFYLINTEANASLCLGAVPQVNQRTRLASCSPTNTAWYMVLIGGYFFACHTHDTGICASARLRPQVVLDWRNNADTSQQFRLI